MKKTDYINKIFKGRKADVEKLLLFGFNRKKNGYCYSTGLLDGLLQMTVTINNNGEISTDVVDIAASKRTNRKETRKIPINNYLDEYEDILDGINDFCFEYNVFHNKQTRKIIEYVWETYQDELEFLWKRFPENAIFRRKDNGKWYAALLTVKQKKLKLQEEGTIEVIDLKVSPDLIPKLLDGKKYLPGYHMNKRHWITIRLDGSVPLKEICRRIDESFVLVGK